MSLIAENARRVRDAEQRKQFLSQTLEQTTARPGTLAHARLAHTINVHSVQRVTTSISVHDDSFDDIFKDATFNATMGDSVLMVMLSHDIVTDNKTSRCRRWQCLLKITILLLRLPRPQTLCMVRSAGVLCQHVCSLLAAPTRPTRHRMTRLYTLLGTIRPNGACVSLHLDAGIH
jgi:hypothetical protein